MAKRNPRTRLVQSPGKTKSPAGLIDLGRLDHECFPDDEPVNPSHVKAGWWWVHYSAAGNAIAFCGLHTDRHSRAHLSRAGVSVLARGQGLQRKMIRLRMKKAASLKVERVLTYTDAKNAPSSNNLAACGFRIWIPGSGFDPAFIRWYKDV